MIFLDADLWKETINDEVDSLEFNGTWHLVDLPSGCKKIGCKWIFKKKLKSYGSVEKYKARLVAKGYRQRENIYFFDTYSLATKITSIKVLIALAPLHGLVIHQMGFTGCAQLLYIWIRSHFWGKCEASLRFCMSTMVSIKIGRAHV